jgi:hypothetical protein
LPNFPEVFLTSNERSHTDFGKEKFRITIMSIVGRYLAEIHQNSPLVDKDAC